MKWTASWHNFTSRVMEFKDNSRPNVRFLLVTIEIAYSSLNGLHSARPQNGPGVYVYLDIAGYDRMRYISIRNNATSRRSSRSGGKGIYDRPWVFAKISI